MGADDAKQVQMNKKGAKNGTKVQKSMLIQEMMSVRRWNLPKRCISVKYMSNKADNLLLLSITGFRVPHRSKKVIKDAKNGTKIP